MNVHSKKSVIFASFYYHILQIMRDNMKDIIVQKAFEQYLIDGYEKVTVSTLQKSLDIGRATMYYYFKSKEDLFEAVMRKYFWDFINGGLNKVTDSTTILELIDIYVDCFKVIARSMADLKNPNITFSNYTGILFYAFSHDEYLATAISDVKKKIHSVWVAAIQNSIENGEIRSDIDVDTIAYTFESVKGNFGERKADETTIKHELELFKKSHLELYKLLKK